jgi:hypothetical protein
MTAHRIEKFMFYPMFTRSIEMSGNVEYKSDTRMRLTIINSPRNDTRYTSITPKHHVLSELIAAPAEKPPRNLHGQTCKSICGNAEIRIEK